jgi:hypothetical protein
MSSRRNFRDNAVMENFFGYVKEGMFRRSDPLAPTR